MSFRAQATAPWPDRALAVLRIVTGLVFQFHAPRSFFPTVNGGVAAVLYCFTFMYLTFAGGGAWSLDGLRARARR